jgi:hypothetical protein
MAAVFAEGVLLSLNIICMISVLGPDLYRSIFRSEDGFRGGFSRTI